MFLSNYIILNKNIKYIVFILFLECCVLKKLIHYIKFISINHLIHFYKSFQSISMILI